MISTRSVNSISYIASAVVGRSLPVLALNAACSAGSSNISLRMNTPCVSGICGKPQRIPEPSG